MIPDTVMTKLVSKTDDMLTAIAEWQGIVDELQDLGLRIRSMAEQVQSSNGRLDNPGVIRLPRVIMPKRLEDEEPRAASG